LAGDVADNQESVGFCIHTPPDDQENNEHHRYRYTHNAWSNAMICTGKPNVLTYVLARELHELLQVPCKVQDIYDKAESVVFSSRPGSKCVVCRKWFGKGARLWKPLPCGDDCSEIFESSAIDMRLSTLIGDSSAVDFILSSVYQLAVEHETITAVAANPQYAHYSEVQGVQDRTALRLPGCPIPLNILKSVIESFPPLSSATNWPELLDGSDEGRNRRKLLSWVSDQFHGLLATVPEIGQVANCGTAHQFLLVNSSVPRETAFSTHYGKRATVFHGTKAARIFSILTDGLKDLSQGTDNLYAFRAPGIYVSNQALVSLRRYTDIFTGWKNSQFQTHRILFGCELVDSQYSTHSQSWQYSFSDQSRVMIRSVFAVPDSEAAHFQNIGHELEKKFKILHAKNIL